MPAPKATYASEKNFLSQIIADADKIKEEVRRFQFRYPIGSPMREQEWANVWSAAADLHNYAVSTLAELRGREED